MAKIIQMDCTPIDAVILLSLALFSINRLLCGFKLIYLVITQSKYERMLFMGNNTNGKPNVYGSILNKLNDTSNSQMNGMRII